MVLVVFLADTFLKYVGPVNIAGLAGLVSTVFFALGVGGVIQHSISKSRLGQRLKAILSSEGKKEKANRTGGNNKRSAVSSPVIKQNITQSQRDSSVAGSPLAANYKGVSSPASRELTPVGALIINRFSISPATQRENAATPAQETLKAGSPAITRRYFIKSGGLVFIVIGLSSGYIVAEALAGQIDAQAIDKELQPLTQEELKLIQDVLSILTISPIAKKRLGVFAQLVKDKMVIIRKACLCQSAGNC